MSDEACGDFGFGADAGGAWLDFGGSSTKETARCKSTLQSLRRRNAWLEDEDLANRVKALEDENIHLRHCLAAVIEGLVAKGVANAVEVAPILEAVRPPVAAEAVSLEDSSDDLAQLAKLVRR